MSVCISARSSGAWHRPRPPRSRGLFFEDQQRSGFGQRPLFPRELALKLLYALGLHRGPGLGPRGLRIERLLGSLPPRGQVRHLQPLATQQRPERGLVQGRRLLHDAELLRAGPSCV
jgi:hypothetical protein